MNKYQTASAIFMIRPVRFRMNEQTAVNNYYQKTSEYSSEELNRKAIEEFDAFVRILRDRSIEVLVIDDRYEENTPDSIFPNNWVSFHEDSTIGLYPMFAENRRKERRNDLFHVLEKHGFVVGEKKDFTAYENKNLYLEGTGSIVLDRKNRKAYCALSPRADKEVLDAFCDTFSYIPIVFHSYQTLADAREYIYHTNVMMCIAEKYAIIGLDSIDDVSERNKVISSLKENNKEIITLTESQLNSFAGNMLVVRNIHGDEFLIMSTQAYMSLSKSQITTLEKYQPIIHSPLDTIETCGGGSARCMMAEIYLPKNT